MSNYLRVVDGVPLTEHHSHQYAYGQILFVKPMGFWHAQAPDGSMTGPSFNLTGAVQLAKDNGWIIPVDTCRWCSGHGYLRVPYTFDLTRCEECQGEGIDPQQPVLVEVTA